MTDIELPRHVAAQLVAGHVNLLWQQAGGDPAGCCPVCCGPCSALKELLDAGRLDDLYGAWAGDDHSGSDIWDPEKRQVRRDWLLAAWSVDLGCHDDHDDAPETAPASTQAPQTAETAPVVGGDAPGPSEPSQALSGGLVVRPGDTLIVRVNPLTTPEHLEHFAGRLKRLADGGGFKTAVIAAEQATVARPDEGRIAELEQRVRDLERAAEIEQEHRMGDDL